jgi:Ca2+-binding EF-hand superfamily protein
LFSTIDSNGNGQISPDELASFGQNLPGSLASVAGGAAGTSTASTAATSANGGIGSASTFSQIDTNGDGTISQDEWTAYGNKLSASNNSSLLQAQEGADGAGRAHHHHHHHGGSGASGDSQTTDPTAAFNQLDTNQDGSISAQEWAAQFSTSGAASAYSTTQSNGQSTDPLLQLINKLIG